MPRRHDTSSPLAFGDNGDGDWLPRASHSGNHQYDSDSASTRPPSPAPTPAYRPADFRLLPDSPAFHARRPIDWPSLLVSLGALALALLAGLALAFPPPPP